MRDREQALRRFRHGRHKFLVAVDILNEGIDVPDVDIVVFLRVTHSRRVFVQQLGRGLRLTSTKSKVSVLDFVSDIRRVAAGFRLNEEDAEYCRSHLGQAEQLRLPPGAVVAFSDAKAKGFFEEYLKDVASVEGMADRARLRFP
jgi:superfamily II DNA or RNA helicase